MLISIDSNLAEVFPSIFERHANRASNRARQPLGPLDDHHSPINCKFFQSQVVDGCPFEPVQIDVIEIESASIFLNEHERWAADLGRIDVETLRNSADEGRLSSSKIPIQKYFGACGELRTETRANFNRFRF